MEVSSTSDLVELPGGVWIPPYSVALKSLVPIECALKDKGICFFKDIDEKMISEQILGVLHPHHTLITEEFLRIESSIFQSFDTSDSPHWLQLQNDLDFPVLNLTTDNNFLIGEKPLPVQLESGPVLFIPKKDTLWRNHSMRWLLGASKKQIQETCKVLVVR